MLRVVNIDMSGDLNLYPTFFGGYAGEHKETRIIVTLPPRMLDSSIRRYRFIFDTPDGETVNSLPITHQNGEVSITLWQDVMMSGRMKMCVAGYDLEDDKYNLIAKTGTATILIKPTPLDGVSNDDVGQPIDIEYIEDLMEQIEAANDQAENAVKIAEQVSGDLENRFPVVTVDIHDKAVTMEKLADDMVASPEETQEMLEEVFPTKQDG